MKEIFLRYISTCYQIAPKSLYVGLLILFCLGTALLMVFHGAKKGMKWSTRLLLFEYVFWIISIALLFRTVMEDRMCSLTPFKSYRAILEGQDILPETILNVAVFIPIGFLLCCSFRRLKWWQVLSIGAGFSLLIEVLQFVFKRGFAEFDDVFHNVLGCAIGLGMYLVVAWVVKPRERLSKTNN